MLKNTKYKKVFNNNYNMLNKSIILFFILILLSVNVFAVQETLGTFKTNEEVRLLQTCSICDYVTLDSVKLPNSTIIFIDENMTKSGNTFYYDFDVTNLNGDYSYNTWSGNSSSPVSFTITTNGNAPADGITIVVYTIIFILIFGFGVIYFLKSLTHVLDLNMDLIDTAIMMVTYLGMWMFYYFSSEYLGNAFINNILEIIIDIGWITHIFFPLIGFALSFIMTNLKFKKKQAVTY